MNTATRKYKMENQNSEILTLCEAEDDSRLIDTTKKIVENEENSGIEGEYFFVSRLQEDTEDIQVISKEKESVSLSQMCRACATTNCHLIPIFKGEGLEHDLCGKIHKHLPIKVTEKDTLPLQLCYHCAATLMAWNELFEGSLDAQSQLLRLQEQAEKRKSTTCQEEKILIEDIKFEKGESLEGPQKKSDQDKSVDVPISERCSVPRTSFSTFLSGRINQKFNSANKKKKKKKKSEESVEINQEIEALPQYFCEYCRNTFNKKSDLQLHLLNCFSTQEENKLEEEIKKQSSNRHRKRRQKTYSCMHCDFDTNKKKILDLHTHEVHSELITSNNKKSIEKQAINEAKMEVDGKIYYHCSECGKNLYSPYTFSWHKRIHTGERPFTCHLCGKQFRVNQGLARHLRETHAGIKKFPCDICGRMFTTKRNVDDHRRIHTGERPYVCNICGKAFKQKASLFVHNRTHSDLFPFKCSYCNQGFRTKTPLMVHITKHTGEKPYGCDICNRHFRIKFELKRHRLVHFDEKPWQCTDCDQCFRQKRYLVNHRKLNHDDQEISRQSRDIQAFLMTKSKKNFLQSSKQEYFQNKNTKVKIVNEKEMIKSPSKKTNLTNLDSSTALNLDSLDPLKCNQCGKKFRLEENFRTHIRIHTGKKTYTCHVCGKQFGLTGSLYYHLKHVHEGVKNHSCDICGRSFAMKAAMKDHRRIHTGERPYVCDSCGKTFKTKASLYIHRKTHTDEYPHQCTFCEKTFRWKQQMLGHLTTHTGIKNHICDICGKAFGVKNDLTRHKKIHSKEKPYSCQQCSLSFAQKRYLKNHERSRHN